MREYPARKPANGSFSAWQNGGSITARGADDGVMVDMGYLPREGRDRKWSRHRVTISRRNGQFTAAEQAASRVTASSGARTLPIRERGAMSFGLPAPLA